MAAATALTAPPSASRPPLVVEGDRLVVNLPLLMQLLSFYFGRPSAPLCAVTGVRVIDTPWAHVRGMRCPGLGLPFVALVCTLRFWGGKDFAGARLRRPSTLPPLLPLRRRRRRLPWGLAPPRRRAVFAGVTLCRPPRAAATAIYGMDPTPAVLVELAPERSSFQRFLVTADDAEGVAAAIRAALLKEAAAAVDAAAAAQQA